MSLLNLVDICIEFCRRDDFARLEAGKICALVSHSTPVTYCRCGARRSALIVINSGLEAAEPQSASNRLAKISDDFKRGSAFFVDVFLTKRIEITEITLNCNLSFGKVSQVTAGYKMVQEDNEEVWPFLEQVWVPVWTEAIPASATAVADRSPYTFGPSSQQAKLATTPCDILRFEISALSGVESAFNICRSRLVLRALSPPPQQGERATTSAQANCCQQSNSMNVDDEAMTSSSQAVTENPNDENADPDQHDADSHVNLFDCPDDIFVYIVDKLPVADRYNAMVCLSATCRRFYDILRRPALYTSLNLNLANTSPYWSLPSVMPFLAARAQSLQHLRISWLPYLAPPFRLASFLSKLPPVLLSFVADNSPVVTDDVVEILAKTQPNLELLSLSGCHIVTPIGFGKISKMSNLRVLQLDDVGISPGGLDLIVENCRKIEQFSARRLPACLEETYRRNSFVVAKSISFNAIFLKLAHTPTLRAVSVDSTCFDDVANLLTFIRRCRHLERLYIESFPMERAPLLSGALPVKVYPICQVISESCPNLRDLLVGASNRKFLIKTKDFVNLLRLGKLERLRIEKADVLAFDVAGLLRSTLIKSVSLSGCQMTSKGLEKLRRDFPGRRIDYYYTEDNVDSSGQDSGDDDNDNSDDGSDNNDDHDDGDGDGDDNFVDQDLIAIAGNCPCSRNNGNDSRAKVAVLSALLSSSSSNYNFNVSMDDADLWIYHVNEYCRRNNERLLPIANTQHLRRFFDTEHLRSIFDSDSDD